MQNFRAKWGLFTLNLTAILRCLVGSILIGLVTSCSSVEPVAPDAAKISLQLLSVAEGSFLVTVPPGILPLKFRDADSDYFVSNEAYTYSVFGKIVAVPGAGVCLTRTAPFRIGVFTAAGACDYHLTKTPAYKLQ